MQCVLLPKESFSDNLPFTDSHNTFDLPAIFTYLHRVCSYVFSYVDKVILICMWGKIDPVLTVQFSKIIYAILVFERTFCAVFDEHLNEIRFIGSPPKFSN